MCRRGRREEEEEEEARRERKRVAKDAHREAQKVAKLLGYSNDVNPFGDSNLLKPFVWGKKEEGRKGEGKKGDGSSAEEKRLQLMLDIERARRRREDKEREAEETERLRAEEVRLRESLKYGDWQREEELFHTAQTGVRSTIRLLERRERPIDVLAQPVLLLEAAASSERDDRRTAADLARLCAELRDPLQVLVEVPPEELDALLEDMAGYAELAAARGSAHLDYWRDLRGAAEAERRSRGGRRDEAMHRSVVAEVRRSLEGKSASELAALEGEVREGVAAGRRADAEYWLRVAEEAAAQRSRLRVRAAFEDMRARQRGVVAALREESGGASADAKTSGARAEWEAVQREFASASASESLLLREEEERGLGEGEEGMGARDEVQLGGTGRRPRYFNRVKTGFDWNFYNQTHYDKENPPPKTVQGYKFNVFFPDLPPGAAPRYSLEAADEQDYAVLRFHAGPPYDDIAFKIVNQEWDVDRRAGFRCVFERGVLQLHFNFKRHRYRR